MGNHPESKGPTRLKIKRFSKEGQISSGAVVEPLWESAKIGLLGRFGQFI